MSLDLPRARVYGGGPAAGGSITSLWRADGKIFREGDTPVRYMGVSAFALFDRIAKDEDISPFCRVYRGFNVLRVWPYVPNPPWVPGWNPPPNDVIADGIRECFAQGFRVELTLLTDDDPRRVPWARGLVEYLAGQNLPGLLLEIGNEPTTHKAIDTRALKAACDASGLLYSSGDYEDSSRWFGSFYTCHTGRTSDWPRRSHDLYEFYTGDGPDKRTVPHSVPCIGDEPGKIEDVGTNQKEWRAYFGGCSLMGGGATVHLETAKLAGLPTDHERPLIAVALDALNTFPADAPNSGPYRRIVEPGNERGGPTENSRTYVVGNYMVRCQQVGNQAPEAGWRSLDADGILWTR